ncbi:DUF1858 domain-containing protein [Alkaliphilus peptidifermentans]|uniref:DUF1858 domain-containing protein n=1 Tax=Alkaliphilus peptidifermentans DSM 18978 TaxID=1120976 RepID=A0A1G5ICS6_9FIRM|nr:DUF1858 domain-containing protein [Alkaliphilus peptidifermentans]SCY73956.1 protein of unknown function [Alkaliphilus peptidifermentans DSM 18978]
MKQIDLNKNVFELTEEYPEIIEIMVSEGFKDIKNPVVRKTAGRLMTIPEGCKMKGINLKNVLNALENANFNF